MPLRPPAAALSSLRAPTKSFRAFYSWKTPRRRRKSPESKTTSALSMTEGAGSIPWGLVRSYQDDLVNRTKSIIGRNQDLMRLEGPVRKFLQNSRNRETLHVPLFKEKWLAVVSKATRQAKAYRIWFLEYQILEDLGLIIQSIVKNKPEGINWADLPRHLRRIVMGMQAIRSARHEAQMAGQRERLFAIATVLRNIEIEINGPEKEREAEEREAEEREAEEKEAEGREAEERENHFRFPSSRLRTVELNLLTAEVLSTELIVRKALLRGPLVEQKVLAVLRGLGRAPDYAALPFVDRDID
ncbi:hypothetical protein NUW58_g6457 [Xylaria curta]|uniref:Uncharacterized protein n=1 Tax=Xylaria curta TaxID=42375 RepID=A0ACC1NTU7_9PEZI|nr:hypothetical protein NUW58_g6457 [Xylaria curta]